MNSHHKRPTVREPDNRFVKALRVIGVSFRQSIVFKHLRDLYGKQVDEKAKQLKEDGITTSLQGSKEDDYLTIHIATGLIGAALLNEKTETQIDQSFPEHCQSEPIGEKLYLVDEAAKM